MRALPLHLADQRAGRTCRDAYPEAFRLSPEDMANAAEVPTVPPLRTTGTTGTPGQPN
ncbi:MULTISPECIES: non-oxidative hydroxyarylic acid decarboxylases subunit D [Streptomyces]|uniref:non-oxidative hydroxyarylic acid decarboxylases subunit D n=1 Tax=Streptomyces TaxID=1883 RepID=UPI0027DBF8F4|nr:MULTISPECIES: non-oxidative hydroxyarylic acid decarboxylases subunit D [Streptomyces]